MRRVVDVGMRDLLLMVGLAGVAEMLFFLGETPSMELAPRGGESRVERLLKMLDVLPRRVR